MGWDKLSGNGGLKFTFWCGKINVSNADLNFFSKFINEFSKDMPFFYGLFSIMFAIFLGIGAAFIRRFASNLRKQ